MTELFNYINPFIRYILAESTQTKLAIRNSHFRKEFQVADPKDIKRVISKLEKNRNGWAA